MLGVPEQRNFGKIWKFQPVGASNIVRNMLAFAQMTPALICESGVSTTERLRISV